MARRRAAGPPNELRRLWPRVLESDALGRCSRQPRCRVAGFSASSARAESAVARVLRGGGGRRGDGLEVTVCARDGGAGRSPDAYGRGGGRATRSRSSYALRRRPLRRRRAAGRRARRRALPGARAPPRHGRVVHWQARGRPADGRPGASDVYAGGVIAYSNEVKERRWASPSRCSRSTAPSRQKRPRRWRGRLRRARSRRGDRRDRRRRAGWGNAGEARGPRLCLRPDAGQRSQRAVPFLRRPRGVRARRRHSPCILLQAASVTFRHTRP